MIHVHHVAWLLVKCCIPTGWLVGWFLLFQFVASTVQSKNIKRLLEVCGVHPASQSPAQKKLKASAGRIIVSSHKTSLSC